MMQSALCLLLLVFTAAGCATAPPLLTFTDMTGAYGPGAIIDTRTGTTIGFDLLADRLSGVAVVYVGERHTDAAHHAVQLRIIRALHARSVDIRIGMEMFDRTYQPVLDQWSAGKLSEEQLLELTHWYANWRFDYGLYREILDFAREAAVPLIALNIPFHLPAKISTGGLDSLRPFERRHIAGDIDLSNEDHRSYVEDIFKTHSIRGREKFEYFYMAQCAWEDSMAQAAAENLGGGSMIVLIGNGHIIRKFGVPARAARRSGADFLTVYLAAAGESVERSYADYIWVTPVDEK